MTRWNRCFKALQIEHLRSPTSAHVDPYDHRALEFYTYKKNRDKDLATLAQIPRHNGQWEFHGPFHAPSSDIFRLFNEQLITGYGLDNMVQPGRLVSIQCEHSNTSIHGYHYRLSIKTASGSIEHVLTPRVVCAMGPAYGQSNSSLNVSPGTLDRKNRILFPNQIIPFLLKTGQEEDCCGKDAAELKKKLSILIVGGRITSAHLACVASNRREYESVTLIKRSKTSERQFDLDNSWMGPGRGKCLDRFWSLP